MFQHIMDKLGKLDVIDSRVQSVEHELKEMKKSLDFVHEEVEDLKKENAKLKKSDGETQERLATLEKQNDMMKNRLIDLQTSILESHLEIQDAKLIKLDRSHRMGKKQRGKTRAIVAKFNYFPDKVRVLANAKKLKDTGIAISEEIVNIRKKLMPVFKKACKGR
ncbi:Hypothetical predicted protein, partial [Paramuricea clavata]